MRAGDVIVNVPDRIKATVEDQFSNNVYSFKIDKKDKDTGGEGWFYYTGTIEELFNYLAGQITFYNRHVEMFGGKPF
jgi:hypothetical protein